MVADILLYTGKVLFYTGKVLLYFGKLLIGAIEAFIYLYS